MALYSDRVLALEQKRQALYDRLRPYLTELGPEAKRPHKCDATHRFSVFSRRCVPLKSMLTRGRFN